MEPPQPHVVRVPSPQEAQDLVSDEPIRDPNESEARLIEILLSSRPERPPWLALDAGHDCAVLDSGLALTLDALVEGVHFDEAISARDLGYKSVAVSVSDLAAVRARPLWMMLSLSLPQREHGALRDWTTELSQGLREASVRFGVHLVGGDLTRVVRGGPIVISITMGGQCIAAPRTRAGARAGDDLWVTGWPGLAAIGWLEKSPPTEALAALHRPCPPLAFALLLDVATAAMDLSDGLASDLPRLSERSGVGFVLDDARVPTHPAIAASPVADRARLGGGDDYELLFTAPPGQADHIRQLAERCGVKVTRIGIATSARDTVLARGGWPESAFVHFEPSASAQTHPAATHPDPARGEPA